MPERYPWYDLVEERGLEQGDILPRCRVITAQAQVGGHAPNPMEAGEEPEFQADAMGDDEEFELEASLVEIEGIVLTQSCDLVADKVDNVLICPLYSFDALGREDEKFLSPREQEQVRRGRYTPYHLLNRCELEGHEREHRVVDLGETYTLPLDHVRDLAEKAGERLRLLPPYREHLAQAFARFYMRVGLPIDIPRLD